MRSSDWSSDVCSSDLKTAGAMLCRPILAGDIHHSWPIPAGVAAERIALIPPLGDKRDVMRLAPELCPPSWERVGCQATDVWGRIDPDQPSNTIRCTFQNPRSEEQTSELQSLMRISYA